MPVYTVNISLPVTEDENMLSSVCARLLGISPDRICSLSVVRTSVDARKKNDIRILYTLSVQINDALKKLPTGASEASAREPRTLSYGTKPLKGPVAVIGLGPAGLFAAWELAKNGYAPLVIERGKPSEERAIDVDRLFAHGVLDDSSNIMFGEGGAGAFSDGKLTTRIKDSRAVDVIDTLVSFGAPADIAVRAKPHVGTDALVPVISEMRHGIEANGGTVLFGSRFCGIRFDACGAVSGIDVERGGTVGSYDVSAVILSIGQGARDTYEMLLGSGVMMAPKPFAAGVRIEHPRGMIDASQFGAMAGHPRLGAAEYHLTHKYGDKGVYTFCMCPGGVVINSSSAQGETVVNGMSKRARDGELSNSAIVVTCDPSDYPDAGPLSGMIFQRELERAAFQLGGDGFLAPYMRVSELISGGKPRAYGAVKPSYRPEAVPRDLSKCLPDFMLAGIRDALPHFGRMIRGFDMGDAVVTAVESRTSSPVRILRGETLEAVGHSMLFPVGEGAGYAGGIVSAAVDGMRAAEAVMKVYKR